GLTSEQAGAVVALAAQDTREVTFRANILARDRDIQEVINYRNVLGWIDEQKNIPLTQVATLETLYKLHHLTMDRLLAGHEIGVFRQKQVVVEGPSGEGVVFRPPMVMEVPFLINDFLAWLTDRENYNIHPVLKAAIAHYQLAYIHPFVEGNGRTARAMSTLILYSQNYDFKKFFSMEEYYDSDVSRYYQSLQSVQKSLDNDLTFWLEYFCYGLALEIDKIKQKVLKLSKDFKLREQLGKQIALSERQIMLLEVLQNQGEITSEDAQQVLPNISSDTILRDIKDLIRKGVIKKQGVTKGVRYILQ
ncbi:Fic family protein, partial [Microgenomates group bacterium]|nr:Fic family protein [Microgenomates group bacterium]